MNTSRPCRAINPELCTFHGTSLAACKIRLGDVKAEHLDALKGSISSGSYNYDHNKVVELQAKLAHAQAEVDAFDENYDALNYSLGSIKMVTGQDDQYLSHNHMVYRDLKARRVNAEKLRAEKMDDISDSRLPVNSGFPASKADAAYILEQRDLGKFVGLTPMGGAQPQNRWKVIGEKGTVEIKADGSVTDAHKIHSFDNPETPSFVRAAIDFRNNSFGEEAEGVGWRPILNSTGRQLADRNAPQVNSNHMIGYEIFSKTDRIAMNHEGKVISKSTLETAR